jgi:cytochrome P450
MDSPQTTAGEPQEREVAGGGPAGCPVEHAAGGTAPTVTEAEPAASAAPEAPPEPPAARPPAAIPASELAGPKLPALVQIFKYWKRPTGFMEDCRQRYGSRFRLQIRIPAKPMYVLTEPEDVKQMFLAPADVLHTGDGSATIEKFTGRTGLAWLDEDEHKVRRKLLMPTMHGKALQRIEAAIDETARQSVADWPAGPVTALHPYVHRLTLDVIREVIFGPAPPKRWEELADLLTHMMEFNYRVASALRIHEMPPRLVRLLVRYRRNGLHDFLERRERADALIAEAVQERRASGYSGDDMLSVLLGITHADGSPLSAVELRDEMMTIFIAGTETSASGVAWSLEHLSRTPAVLDRLVAEIDKGEDDAYLTATVYEMLRLRPPIPHIIFREVMKPIEIGGVRYEPGVLLWASAHLLHHNPRLYPDPYEFRPERFLGVKPGTYSWIPFGGGRIRCLGSEIGLAEMKAVLREVLARYDLRRDDPTPEPVRSRSVLTLPGRGAYLALRTRAPEPSPAAG